MSPRHHGLEIMHSEGIATVPYDKLPQNLQAKYAEKAKQLKAAEKIRQEQIANQRKMQQNIFDFKSLCGYTLGEKLDSKDIKNGKKFGEDSFICKIKSDDFLKQANATKESGITQVNVYVTKGNIIYRVEILTICSLKKIDNSSRHTRKARTEDESFFRRWAKKNYSISLPYETNIKKKFVKNNREMCVESYDEFVRYKQGKYSTPPDSLHLNEEISITDLTLQPLKDKVFRNVYSKRDKMQKITWYESKTKTNTIKNGNDWFSISPYVGKDDNGSVLFRIYTSYLGENWIFYTKVQIMDQDGNDFFIIPGGRKKGEVTRYGGVNEWADFLIKKDDFLKIKNAKTLRCKFYGKYSHEFDLPKEHIINFNDMINLYEYLKNNKN